MKPNPGLAIVGGLLGTPAMSGVVYALAPLIGVKMDIVDILATMLGGWTMGMIVHVLNGAIFFPLIYSLFVYRFLPGAPARRGMAFGLTLWLGSQVVVMPLLGAGLFSTQMGGVRAAGASLLGHLVYGAVLGSLAGDVSPAASIAKPQCKQIS